MLSTELPIILFYLFSLLTIGSALMVITSRDPVKAVLFLILCFFNGAGIFLLLQAELVAMLLVIVYVGAVAVLFLFVVMMLNINTAKAKENVIGYAPLGIVIAIILFVELFFIIQASTEIMDSKGLAVSKAHVEVSANDKTLNKTITNNLDIDKTIIGNTNLTHEGEDGNKENILKEKPLTNAEQIGMVLYTKYAYLFQLSGLILLVAMIGAITLAHRQREGVKKQNISDQLSRNRKKTIEVVKVESGKGV